MEEKYNILPDKVTFRISDDITSRFASFEQKNNSKTRSILYTSVFRVSDTGASYRFLNNLEAVGLLPNRRKNQNSGWRKLNWVEHAFVLIVIELRKYGVKTESIRPFADAFLDKSNNVALLSIMSVLTGVEISLIFKSDGTCAILDPIHTGFYESEELTGTGVVPDRGPGEIQFKLSYFINQILINVGKEPKNMTYFFGKKQTNDSIVGALMETEKEAVIRTRNLTKNQQLYIRLKTAGEVIFDQEQSSTPSEKDAETLLSIVGGDFGDFSGFIRNGKVQGLKTKKSDIVKD